GDGREVVLPGDDIADLDARLHGRVLLRDDSGYDDARRILNPTANRHPALIAQVTGAADVGLAVDFAREHDGLLLAVKCGGHSASGKSTCDRGMMIDLSPFRSVHVAPEARRARVTGGSLLAHVDHETMAHGLVTPMGTVSHTGVGGLVTGGGFGRLARRYGLSIDNLVSVDVVSADGRLRHADEDENPDLFWGVRGGSGNFGVVTSFEFRLHPMQREVVGGTLVFPLSDAREVLNVYAEYGPEAPDELQIDSFVGIRRGGEEGAAGFSVCWSGPASEAERALAPLRQVGTPVADEVQSMDYVALQRSGDFDDPRAQASYLKSGFIAELPSELISAIVDRLEGDPRRTTQLFFQQSGGAISRVPGTATAFSQRNAIANMLSSVDWEYGWEYGDDPAAHVRWLREYWSELEPYTQGFYVNDAAADATAADYRRTYRENHERLVQVKNRYDPDNLFRLNANVEPTV
ncbi:MAG: FAD-binding oxidoreductase, partial [Gemmatimonadota bacterium]